MRGLLTKSREANALLMKFKPKDNDLILLVEGKTDRILFSKFIISKRIIINDCDGSSNVIELIEELRSRDFNSMIGILDKDFKELDEELIEDEIIFYTDYHDIEVSIIESNAINVIFEKYANEEKLENFHTKFRLNYRDYIFKLASFIGYLKWANKIDDLGLVFKPKTTEGKKLKLEKIFNFDLEYLGDERMVTYVKQYSNNRGTNIKNTEEIIESYNKHKGKAVDLLHLCNGHDLSYIIAISIKRIIGNTNVSFENIENDLRLSYDSNCFKLTNLYKSIKHWEESNVSVLI